MLWSSRSRCARPSSTFRCLWRDSDLIQVAQVANAELVSGSTVQRVHEWRAVEGAGPVNQVWMTADDRLRAKRDGANGFRTEPQCLADLQVALVRFRRDK